jgi:putative transposase
MARLARVVAPGVPHHVTQRGNRGLETFFCDDDYRAYRGLLAEHCDVHLILVPSDEDGLRAALGEAHRRYTRRINLREGWRGHLWQERFHSFPMDRAWLMAAARHVELNPVRAGLVRRPRQWPWSSARAHLAGRDDDLVRVAPLLRLAPDWKDFLAEGLEEERLEALRRHARTGRPLGAKPWVKRMEKRLGRPLAPRKAGRKPKAERAGGGRRKAK